MNNSIAHQICDDITDAILISDAVYVVDSWACDSNVTLSARQPSDPAYSVFRQFYELASQLRLEYSSFQIKDALQQFHYQQQRGELFPLSPVSSHGWEMKMIEYCLRAVEEKKDVEVAFRKWID